ncbi:unnamed protein product [Meganyctiphanes norvegica]|uniref:Kinase n=1 Tax=Meganyctiphanes norvegica TaxID=48144 RepID=A0AAV2QQH2_MEGNR
MKAPVQMAMPVSLEESTAMPQSKSKDTQDLALVKLLLLLQVAGERKTEIEELLRGRIFPAVTDDKQQQKQNLQQKKHQQKHLQDQKEEDPEQQPQDVQIRPKRGSLKQRWRKHQLKKKLSSEDEDSQTRSSSSSFDEPVLCNGHVPLETVLGAEASSDGQSEGAEVDQKDQQDMSMLQRLALNALNLTAPASSVLLRNQRNSWVQLSGHPGSLAPAGPGTIWKKRGPDPIETIAYKALSNDPARNIVPTFYREISYQGEYFIEMRDLLYDFTDPCVMDIKMGTRTFLESEVSNTKERKDLYEKMIKVCPSAPTEKENENKALTKLRYMDFRDNMSSSRSLGFRIEALKMANTEAVTELKRVRSREDVVETMSGFLKGRDSTKRQVVERLKQIRSIFQMSPFFQNHEVIGSSILIVYDEDKAGVWMIDFAKTVPAPEGLIMNHRTPWTIGNHEEGYLTGLDNLIKVVEEVPVVKSKRLGFFRKS